MMRELLPKRPTSTQRDSSASRVTTGIPKRRHVLVACHGCRRRKVKCDDRRPRCTSCLVSNEDCQFTIPRFASRGLTMPELPFTSRKHQCLLAVFELLRVVEEDEADGMLQQIRSAQSVDDFLDSVQEATLLLPLSSGPSSQDSSVGETNTISLDLPQT